jgi:tetratricopeptide (TPR) repeat protein
MIGGGSVAREPMEVLSESPLGQVASRAGDWARSNRPLAYGIGGAVLLIAAVGIGWSVWRNAEVEAAGKALDEAVQIANAELRPASDGAGGAAGQRSGGEPEQRERRSPTFENAEARAQAALEAFRRVVAEHGGTEAALWAQLGEARMLLDLGRTEEARRAYEAVLRAAGDHPQIAWRALEGIGISYEITGDWERAIERYEELRSVDGGAFAAPADYHIARMRIALGQRVEATTQLRSLVERLRADAEDREPAFPYVLAQAEVRLRQLDPTAVGGADSTTRMVPGRRAGSDGPEGLDAVPPEVLEELRRQLREGASGSEGGAQ